MTMEEITHGDVQAAYDNLIAKLRESYEQNPLLWVESFGEAGPPYEQWVELIGRYIAASPSCAQALGDTLERALMPPLRSNSGEAGRDESGNETSQALSDPVENIKDAVEGWADDAGIEFVNGYLFGQYGLQDKLQLQYEFGAALTPIMLAQQGVLLYARAGVIDILDKTADVLHGATESREQRRDAIRGMLTDTLVQTGVALVTGQWVAAAAAAVRGVAEAAVTDLTWPETDDPAEICLAMVDAFDTLHAELETRAGTVNDALAELHGQLTGRVRETLLPRPTADPTRPGQPRPRQQVPVS